MHLMQSKKRLRELEEKLNEVKQKKVLLSDDLVKTQIGREETEERAVLLLKLEKKQADKNKLAKELEQYKSCDPQRLKELCECV